MKLSNRQIDKKRLELSMTSMIDVVFLLLIFFIVTTTFVSATGAQPFWDWGYYMIMLQIIVVLSGIAAVIWTINIKMWKKQDKDKDEEDDQT